MAGCIENYRRVAVQTASPRQIMVMAHERAILALQQSIERLEQGDLGAHKAALRSGQALVLQIPQILDLEGGGELVLETCRFYAYVNRGLLLADLKREAGPIREALLLLGNMLSVWRGAAPEIATPAADKVPAAAVRYA